MFGFELDLTAVVPVLLAVFAVLGSVVVIYIERRSDRKLFDSSALNADLIKSALDRIEGHSYGVQAAIMDLDAHVRARLDDIDSRVTRVELVQLAHHERLTALESP